MHFFFNAQKTLISKFRLDADDAIVHVRETQLVNQQSQASIFASFKRKSLSIYMYIVDDSLMPSKYMTV